MSSVCVVTGAAGGMGAACARAMAAAADALLLADRDEAGLARTAEALARDTRATVSTLTGDIADPTHMAALVARTRELGRLGALVHTAGVSPSMADWREVLRVDLTGVARLLDAFLACAEPGSAAVCLASIAGHLGAFDPEIERVLDAPLAADFEDRFRSALAAEPDAGATYRLAKRGVIRLCERAAAAWGARGGRVVSLSPGLIDTGMGRLELRSQPVKEQMVALTPLRSPRHGPDAALPGHMADVADAVAYLCSEKAAFISGCDVRVDGGLIGAMNHRG